MAIDFTLTTEQKALQATARDFAQGSLKPLVAKADEEPDPQKAFRMVKPAYIEAYKLGFAMGPIPKEYGGGGVSNVDLQIVAEEICAVDPGFACILLVNGLALMPVVWFGSEDQKRKWLGEATSASTQDYLAGWVVSEPAGIPGGTAAFDHPDPHPVGHGTTAEYDKANGEYILNGRKYWPSSSAGWDFKGANVNTVTVRTDKSAGGKKGLSCILVPRGTPGMRFEPNINKLGHRLNQNVHMVFENCRVPEENAFAVGNGDLVISKAFTWSGPVAGIAATAVGRSAYEYALNWAKTYTAAGDKPIIYHQAVGYMLADAAMRIEACRYLSWKAAHYLDMYDSEGQAFGAMSKVFCSETMFDTVYKCMQVMGINSLDRAHPMEKLLREAAVLPIYDAGNIGMQRRKIWGVIAHPDYDPRAFVDSKPVRFDKSMEGLGVKALAPEPVPGLTEVGWVSSTSAALDFRVNGSALPMYALFAVCLAVLVVGVRRLLRRLDAGGEPEEEASGRGSTAHRFRRLVELVVLQRRIVRWSHPRWTHLPIFWGFVVLALGSLTIMIDVYVLRPLGLEPGRGLGFKLFQGGLDLFGLIFVGGVGLAVYRRLRGGHSRVDDGALVVLGLLLGIGLSGFILEGLRMRIEHVVEPWAFAGSAVATLIATVPGSTDGAVSLYRFLWWFHTAAAFGLIAAVPYTLLRHLFTSPLHIALSEERPSGALTTPFRLEELVKSGRFDVKVGASSAADLPWHGRLGLAACAGSGACREVCPAHAAGTPLDPMRLVETLRNGKESPGEDEIWSCTLCGACAEACPVLVDPPGYVVELRRGLVAAGRLGRKRTDLLGNLARAQNPYGLNGETRGELPGALGLPALKDRRDVEMVYWIGCAATFDSRARAIARATAEILGRAGVRCGVLGPEEVCCGDPARRVGEEGMFQELALKNIQTLQRRGVRSILTHCAHCFNTLRNEYPALGGSFEVVHHTALIRDLLHERAIKPGRSMPKQVTLHDSCYVGRFNDGVDPPRAVLGSIPGTLLREMERCGRRSFCCGAGGANYWYEVPRRETMGAARMREAQATGAELLVTECPYCLKVFENAELPVLDIAEWVAASLDREERS